MARVFPSQSVQSQSHHLRNHICRLNSPVEMAQVSSHLRNFAVAEVIGFIGMLDGHPQIGSAPGVSKSGAAFQQAKGTSGNPLAHAIPANLLLNGADLVTFYKSAEAQNEIRRVFGMGVMAPGDWESKAFPYSPKQNNVVDSLVERNRYGGGLVEAFEACAQAAVDSGQWDQSGRRRHDLKSLNRLISEIYDGTWMPKAREAYGRTRSRIAVNIAAAGADAALAGLLKQRLDIVSVQIRQFEKDTSIPPEAANNVWKFCQTESW